MNIATEHLYFILDLSRIYFRFISDYYFTILNNYDFYPVFYFGKDNYFIQIIFSFLGGLDVTLCDMSIYDICTLHIISICCHVYYHGDRASRHVPPVTV